MELEVLPLTGDPAGIVNCLGGVETINGRPDVL